MNAQYISNGFGYACDRSGMRAGRTCRSIASRNRGNALAASATAFGIAKDKDETLERLGR
jgi:hypothetical protein